MPLREQKGNMYDFVTHTFNAIKGQCEFECNYCYMKINRLKPVRLEQKELNTDLGKDNVIFVGSSCDMWSHSVPNDWIDEVLQLCRSYDNTYLFQSKNPERFRDWLDYMPSKVIFGTTIESDIDYPDISKAPPVKKRAQAIANLRFDCYDTMVTLEPLLKFNLENLVELINSIAPDWVNIGADSKGHHLPEPSPAEVQELIKRLSVITEVKSKHNLKRLLKEDK